MTDNQSPNERVTLLEDDARCVRILAACRRFAVNLGGAAGHYATFGQNEEVLLSSFQLVEEAHRQSDGTYDPRFAQRCRRAGLTANDVQLLQDRLHMLQQSVDSDDDFET